MNQQMSRLCTGRSLVIAAADASVRVKLGMAAERGSLDLSECDLTEVPPGAFDIVKLEVTLMQETSEWVRMCDVDVASSCHMGGGGPCLECDIWDATFVHAPPKLAA